MIGTNPNVSDPSNSANLTTPILNASGHPSLTFGVDQDASASSIWILSRSTDLVTFTEIFRFDGPTQTPTNQFGVVHTLLPATNPTSITVTDKTPPAGKAFYRFEAKFAAP